MLRSFSQDGNGGSREQRLLAVWPRRFEGRSSLGQCLQHVARLYTAVDGGVTLHLAHRVVDLIAAEQLVQFWELMSHHPGAAVGATASDLTLIERGR